jgi:imidazolonepropionase-like amidohydrolase
VPVLAGTDVAGTIAGEVAMLARHGLDPAEAIAAATTTAYGFLGEDPARAGSPANLVSYESDPRNDPSVLAAPAAVIVNGVRIR